MSLLLKVIKKADDRSLGEKVLRISIGGTPQGAYIVYRGDLGEVQALLRAVERVFSRMSSEPTISPDDGKHFA